MKALVVDDSATMRRILKTMLVSLGFDNVAEAIDGLEAVKYCEIANVDLILMDWNMPNLSGIEALKQMFAGVFTTYPDLHVTPDDIMEEGDKVAAAGQVPAHTKPGGT